jgi:UDP-glucose 4-epimerase
MKVLVSGATGHVGSRLAVNLRDAGLDVGITSRQNLGEDDWVHGLRVHLTGDVRNTHWDEILDDYTHVVHLVSPLEGDCQRRPDEARGVVVEGSRKLGESAARAGIQVVYLSTSQVYGPTPLGMIDESSPCRASTVYAEVHLLAEHLLRDVLGDKVTIVRLSNSVGIPSNPRCDAWHLVAHDLAREAASSGSITLRSSGLQHRSFVPLSEVSRALRFILEYPLPLELVNVANPVSESVRSMAARIARMYAEKKLKEVLRNFPEPQDGETENPFSISSPKLAAAGFIPNCEAGLELELATIFGLFSPAS